MELVNATLTLGKTSDDKGRGGRLEEQEEASVRRGNSVRPAQGEDREDNEALL